MWRQQDSAEAAVGARLEHGGGQIRVRMIVRGELGRFETCFGASGNRICEH